jgi:hypothetical protein
MVRGVGSGQCQNLKVFPHAWSTRSAISHVFALESFTTRQISRRIVVQDLRVGGVRHHGLLVFRLRGLSFCLFCSGSHPKRAVIDDKLRLMCRNVVRWQRWLSECLYLYVLNDAFRSRRYRIKHTPPGGKSEYIVLFAQQFAEGLLALFLAASASKWILTVHSLRITSMRYIVGRIDCASGLSETQLK